MPVTQTEYANAKGLMERIQRLPRENQQTIMKMVSGAVMISEMYRDASASDQSKTEQHGA